MPSDDEVSPPQTLCAVGATAVLPYVRLRTLTAYADKDIRIRVRTCCVTNTYLAAAAAATTTVAASGEAGVGYECRRESHGCPGAHHDAPKSAHVPLPVSTTRPDFAGIIATVKGTDKKGKTVRYCRAGCDP